MDGLVVKQNSKYTRKVALDERDLELLSQLHCNNKKNEDDDLL